VTIRISELPPWDRSQLLDSQVWVDTKLGVDDRGHDRVLAAFAAPDADPATPPVAGAELAPLWTALRSVPRGMDLVINVDQPGEVLIESDEIDPVLGGDRATASILSFRQRARWGARWVLAHRGPTGRFFGTLAGREGRQALPLWTDPDTAEQMAPPGATVAQAYLLDVLAGGDEVDYALDPASPEGIYVDTKLRAEILATEPLFVAGYFTQLGMLDAAEYTEFFEAGALAVAEARGSGRPLAGLWVVGYQIEDAPSRVVFVVDVENLDEAADFVVDAINRQPRRPERTETVRLQDLSSESQEFVRLSPDLASS